MTEQIMAGVNRLVGLVCWHCFVRSNSSVLSIHFGNKVPRDRKRLPALPPEDPRNYEGEYGLFIECAWRLETDQAVVTVWSDWGPGRNELIANGIAQVYGRKVTSVELVPPGMDLTLSFEGGYHLRIFADTSDRREQHDAWGLYHHAEDLLLLVGPKGMWTTDKTQAADGWSSITGSQH